MQKTIIFAILSALYLTSAAVVSDEVVCLTEDEVLTVEGNCDEYIKCEGGIPYVYECPEGLQFDLKYATCEVPLSKGSCTFEEF